MEKIRILGISGSPRRGNTEIMVKEALDSARELPNMETDYYSLADKTISPCDGCFKCTSKEATVDNPCPSHPDDDAVDLVKKMLEFDGFIVGCPVYIGSVTAQLKAFIDRSIMMTELGKLGPVGMRNKVCGAAVCSWDRNGGHEMVIMEIWRWAILADMLIVGIGPERVDAVNYWGACAIQAYHPDRPEIFWDETNSPEELTAVKHDELGMQACRRIGKRVAEMAKVIKTGFGALPEGETCWPQGPAGGFGEDYAHFY
jgi:multimeric flavodoxin WrbA